MRFTIALALATLGTPPAELAGQLRTENEPGVIEWMQPTVLLGDEAHPVIGLGTAGRNSPQVARDESAVPSIMGAMLLASLGSAVGGFAGAYVGLATQSGGDDYLAGALVGGLVGSVTGAALGASAVTHRGGRALLGSVAGSLLGLAIMHDSNSDSAALTYFLVHGAVTGLIAGIKAK